MDNYAFEEVEPAILDLAKQLPVNQWVSFEELSLYMKYNFLSLQPIRQGYAKEHLYFESKKDIENGFRDRFYIDEKNAYEYINLPFTKGVFFFLAAYGLVDIAYDEPDLSELGVTAKSPYDKLRYIRLNPLGAFVLGKSDHFEIPTAITNTSIALSPDSLTITVDPDDQVAPTLIEPFSRQVSSTRYQTDASFFLRECRSKDDLDHKIHLFRECVRSNVPANWESFFKTLRQKLNPLEIVGDYQTFKIPADNVQLKEIIVRDEVIQSLTLKAEGYHILVHQKNLSKFKKRLSAYGYLIVENQ